MRVGRRRYGVMPACGSFECSGARRNRWLRGRSPVSGRTAKQHRTNDMLGDTQVLGGRQMQFPTVIEQAVRKAAIRFGRALDFLEWPNGNRNAPPHELNALMNLQCALGQLQPPFYFYSEGSIAERGRVDLMASNGEISLAIEAKGFGRINERSDSIALDLARLREFTPAYYRGRGDREIKDWWGASQRWGLIIISSFRGDEVRDAWLADSTDEAARELSKYPLERDRPRVDGTGFLALRSTFDLYRFAAPVPLGDRWSDTGRGHLLCGAVAL